jgi:hypothetical protein
MVVVQSSSQIVFVFIIDGFNSAKNTRDQIWLNKISKTKKKPTRYDHPHPNFEALGSPNPVVEGAAQFVALVPETHKLIAIGIGVFPSVLAKYGWPDQTIRKQNRPGPRPSKYLLKMCKKV